MRQIGRRALFFGSLVVVSLVLYYPTPPEFRWVCVFTASLAGFWAVGFALEDLTAPTGPPPRRRPSHPESPFGPPPRPGAGP